MLNETLFFLVEFEFENETGLLIPSKDAINSSEELNDLTPLFNEPSELWPSLQCPNFPHSWRGNFFRAETVGCRFVVYLRSLVLFDALLTLA